MEGGTGTSVIAHIYAKGMFQLTGACLRRLPLEGFTSVLNNNQNTH